MNIFQKLSSVSIFSIKISKFLLFSSVSIFFLFFLSSNIPLVNADATNNGGNYSTDSNSIPDQKDTTLYLRKPLLPGEDSIDVGRDNGALGILANYISMVYRYVLALGGIIAVLVVMFSGFQIMTSGGNSEARGEAKTMIIKTLMGVAMLFLAGLFLYAINPNFYVFGGGSNTGGGDSSYSSNSSSNTSNSNTSSGNNSGGETDLINRRHDSN